MIVASDKCISEFPALKVEVWTKETPSFMPIKAQRPHPSHSFSPLYKGFSEDYVRDGLKIVI